MSILPYRDLILGQDYWIQDQVLPNALEIAQRCMTFTTWTLGSPWRPEPWPGMRAPGALTGNEVGLIQDCVSRHLNVPHLIPQSDSEAGISGHNHIQICGGAEGVARPHVDSARICDYAAVLYLHPSPPTAHCGTSFYRLHLPGNPLMAIIVPKIMRASARYRAYPMRWILRCLRKFWKLPMSLIDWWRINRI